MGQRSTKDQTFGLSLTEAGDSIWAANYIILPAEAARYAPPIPRTRLVPQVGRIYRIKGIIPLKPAHGIERVVRVSLFAG